MWLTFSSSLLSSGPEFTAFHCTLTYKWNLERWLQWPLCSPLYDSVLRVKSVKFKTATESHLKLRLATFSKKNLNPPKKTEQCIWIEHSGSHLPVSLNVMVEMLLPQQTTPYKMAVATTDSKGSSGVRPSLQKTGVSSAGCLPWPFSNGSLVLSVQFDLLFRWTHSYLSDFTISVSIPWMFL